MNAAYRAKEIGQNEGMGASRDEVQIDVDDNESGVSSGKRDHTL